jgi:segregation and condensation protein A
LEVTDVRLVDIVTEYLTYLDEMRELDMAVTSEDLLIAATLVQLKARHLLPDGGTIDLDEELALAEERDRLLARLLSCLTFKDVAAVLAHRLDNSERYVPRIAGLDPEITPLMPDVSLGVTVAEFAGIASRAFDIATEPDLDHLNLELPSVDAAIADLQAKVTEGIETDFDELVDHLEGRLSVIAYFLALLELVRWGAVRISQDDALSRIAVAHNPDVHPEGLEMIGRVSEWST